MFLDEAQKTGSPDFLDVLQKKVREISVTTEEFVGKLWNYIEGVVIKALMHHSDSSLEFSISLRGQCKISLPGGRINRLMGYEKSLGWIG